MNNTKINNSNLLFMNNVYFLLYGEYLINISNLINLDLKTIKDDVIDINQKFDIYSANNIINTIPFKKISWHEFVNYIEGTKK